MANPSASTVLQVALESQFLTMQQVRDALRELAPGATSAEVTQFLVEKGYLQPAQVEKITSDVDVAEELPRHTQVFNAPAPQPASFPVLTGKTLGRFDILRELGRGGMAVVYEARLRSTGARVALKVLSSSLCDEAQVLDRFQREARAAAKLRHSNIVRVFGSGEEDGLHYIAMDLVAARPLSEVVAAGPLDPGRAAAIVHAVSEALVYAHSAGLIHRDVKPSNILLAEGDHPLLMDFGLARDTGAAVQTATGMVLGTIAYMPPEQARGEHVDAQADVYSLGATLYELTTGKRPFLGDTWQRLIPQVLMDEPVPPRRVVPVIPEAVERVTLKAMAKDKTRRYPSMDAMRSDLGACIEGLRLRG